MGFVQKIFGGLFAFIGSFFGFLGGLLGIGKSEYFRELEEGKEKPADSAQAAPESAKVQPSAAKAEKPAAAVKAPEPTAAPVVPAPVAKATTQPAEPNFATKYLIPTTNQNDRRRPGPSMNSFIDMARQVKS